MILQKNTHIADIQKAFITNYPHLKIEFFKVAHEKEKGSPGAFKYNHDHTLMELNDMLKEGEIKWDSNMTVAELEYQFESRFGLHVQIYRKSGEIWLQTSATDSWKLSMQESKAR